MDVSELFWEASVEEIKNGYVKKDGCFICLICGESFEDGVIYKENENLLEARKAVINHITAKHGSSFEYLMGLNKKYTGLSDIQREYLLHAFRQYSDREIAKAMGSSESTIRNHRFKLREKAHQAKVFLAITELIEQRPKEPAHQEQSELVTVHKSASMVDLRYAVTREESQRIAGNYFDDAGHLKEFPSKEKKKIVVLRQIMNNFTSDRQYTEAEINRVLERIFEDYVTIRRELIEYGFMDRTKDCSQYWVKK